MSAGTQDAATKEEKRLTHLASLLLPLRRCTAPDKKGWQPLAAHLVTHEIKWKAKDAEHTARLHQQAPELLRIARALQVFCRASLALPYQSVMGLRPVTSLVPVLVTMSTLGWTSTAGFPPCLLEALSWNRFVFSDPEAADSREPSMKRSWLGAAGSQRREDGRPARGARTRHQAARRPMAGRLHPCGDTAGALRALKHHCHLPQRRLQRVANGTTSPLTSLACT